MLADWLTLLPARTLNDWIIWSAVSWSLASRVMKSMNESKLMKLVLLGSTIDMMRWKSASPLVNKAKPKQVRQGRGTLTGSSNRSHYLFVISDTVADRDEARSKFLGIQSSHVVLVEMVERHSELVHLLLADSFRVPGENLETETRSRLVFHQWRIKLSSIAHLVLDFVDVSCDWDTELFPSDANCLHCEAGVSILKYHCLLYFLDKGREICFTK